MFVCKTENRLDSVDIRGGDIYLTIKKLNLNKAHGSDDVFITVIKLCDKLLLSHGAECNMGNIFRVSRILQLISRAFRRVK